MEQAAIRIIGIDPGLRTMGWGVIEASGARIAYVASGAIQSSARKALSERLRELHLGLAAVISEHAPMEAAVEETYVNRDPQSALKLGQARGIALVVPALAGIKVAEYAANLIKKTVTGSGHAEKAQIALMVRALLPGSDTQGADAADALAAAITHAQIRLWARNLETASGPRA
jgi:crossover junction endodeoxyribonuclease RuvC